MLRRSRLAHISSSRVGSYQVDNMNNSLFWKKLDKINKTSLVIELQNFLLVSVSSTHWNEQPCERARVVLARVLRDKCYIQNVVGQDEKVFYAWPKALYNAPFHHCIPTLILANVAIFILHKGPPSLKANFFEQLWPSRYFSLGTKYFL